MPDLYCPKCEYNLTGLTENRCPECGTEFDLTHIQRLAEVAPKPISLLAVFLYTIIPPVLLTLLMVALLIADLEFLMGTVLVGLLVYASINALWMVQRLQVRHLLHQNRPAYGRKSAWASLLGTFTFLILQITIAIAFWYFLFFLR